VISVNDAHDRWDGDAPGHIETARAAKGGDVVDAVAPAPGDRFLFKPRYSALDGTALDKLLSELGATRLVLAGAATEMCVAQTGIDARELRLPGDGAARCLRDRGARNERISIEYLEHVTGSVILTITEWLESRGPETPSRRGGARS
jgi:nicotinamidase-related amidase